MKGIQLALRLNELWGRVAGPNTQWLSQTKRSQEGRL
jgi:hypothetical protein